MKKIFEVDLSNIYIAGVLSEWLREGDLEHSSVITMLERHMRNDCDNKYEEDREYNLTAWSDGFGRIFSVYYYNCEKIYVITDFDTEDGVKKILRTSIMLASDY